MVTLGSILSPAALVQSNFLFRIRFGLLFRWRGTLLVFSLSFRANCKSRHKKKLDGLWPCMIRRGFSKSSAALQRLLLSCNYQLRTAVDTSGCKSFESISYFKHLFSRISKSPFDNPCRRQTKALFLLSVLSACVMTHYTSLVQFVFSSKLSEVDLTTSLWFSKGPLSSHRNRARLLSCVRTPSLATNSFLSTLNSSPPNNVCVLGQRLQSSSTGY